nr:helix-turn-helix transcriptional regulator [uncultured Ruminococcus sp.]
MNILCENIRTLRKARGLTQKELAEKLDISDKTVSRWESGVQLPEASLIP